MESEGHRTVRPLEGQMTNYTWWQNTSWIRHFFMCQMLCKVSHVHHITILISLFMAGSGRAALQAQLCLTLKWVLFHHSFSKLFWTLRWEAPKIELATSFLKCMYGDRENVRASSLGMKCLLLPLERLQLDQFFFPMETVCLVILKFLSWVIQATWHRWFKGT